MMPPPTLDYADIQGNLLHGYGAPHVTYQFLGIQDGADGRKLLSQLCDQVTTAVPLAEGARHETAVNVAVTFAGLAALGVHADVLAGFPDEFREPMPVRSLRLGDTGPSGLEQWDAGLGTGDAHLLVTLNATTAELLAERLRQLRALVAGHPGVSVVHEQRGDALDGSREHFGYADGFSQPRIRELQDPAQPPIDPYDHRAPLPAGEFVLGYPDLDDQVVDAPVPDLMRNGTYVVWRKLHQDVARFRAMLERAATGYGGGTELLAAKIVGRWRDGMPLVLEPTRVVGDLGQAVLPKSVLEPDNDFGFADADPAGLVCPLGAHIRRTNPRDSLGWGGRMSIHHRIIRRGMPYGPPLPDAAPDDGVDRGLVFVCFQASIRRQFEVVQMQWCNDGNAFGLGNDMDLLLGDNRGSGKMTVQGTPPWFIPAEPELVVTRGCEYLLMPGLGGLRSLAAGSWIEA
jgi:Dyp-type peroxidase family